MALKWTLKRSTKVDETGISIETTEAILEFETGSPKEAHGFLQEEGSALRDIFGTTFIDRVGWSAEDKAAQKQPDTAAPEEPKTRKPRTKAPEAIAPPPLPVPAAAAPAPATTVLPPNQLVAAPATLDIPAILDRRGELPTLPAPPTAPPVGLLGPKVVAALEAHKDGNVAADPKGQVLADWLASAGLTISGKTFDEACRVVLMTSDEKLRGVAEAFGVQ